MHSLGDSNLRCHLSSCDHFLSVVRMEHSIDMSTAIKFIYVAWVGANVPFVKKGRFGVVSGSVKSLFNVSTKYHVGWLCALVCACVCVCACVHVCNWCVLILICFLQPYHLTIETNSAGDLTGSNIMALLEDTS